MMNSYQRVTFALDLNVPDRVPILEWGINPNVIKQLVPGMGVQEFMATELDAVIAFYEFPEGDKEGVITDRWGIKRKSLGQDYPIPFDYPIKCKEDLKNYSPPSPVKDSRLSDIEQLVRKYKYEKAIICTLETVFTFAWGLVGMENFFKLLKTDSSFVKRLLDISFRYNFELAKQALRSGADAIMCGDDLAYKKGLMISLEDFSDFLLPYYSKMVQLVHDEGGYFIKHTDGNIWDLLEPFSKIGIDAINPLEPLAGMKIGKVKKDYGDQMCLIGNIDCGELLSNASPEDVRQVVKETIEKAAPEGGYIMASSNEIHSAVKPENFKAMIETTKQYGQYELLV